MYRPPTRKGHCATMGGNWRNQAQRGAIMAAFNAIIIGAVGGVLLVFLWHLVALVGGFGVSEGLSTLLFLVGWAISAILILKA